MSWQPYSPTQIYPPGPTGPTGPTGPAGATGATGPVGPMPAGAVQVIATVADIDVSGAPLAPLYTVPAGQWLVVVNAIGYLQNTATASANSGIAIGKGLPGFADISIGWGMVCTTGATTDWQSAIGSPTAPIVYQAGDVIEYQAQANAVTGGPLLATIELVGYLVAAP